ncbi:hypothetical protein BCF33_1241 [Hasllibacter halocynthiae]|uniref:Flp pilus assembly pilin Flp n=1 Tax=Hasllibacter halocynthiae TaxID=595589 RepID=A0A2T0X9L6_9RHOB|nr:hypothetical protein [Hasllibacter halocynthiae]PRY95619.1 hypothetical protein BCF33_1241 [Hasllibacter halocynthiae]
MKRSSHLHRFLRDEDGAVTVDWVVLTAAVAFICIAVGLALRPALADLTGDTNGVMLAYDIETEFEE